MICAGDYYKDPSGQKIRTNRERGIFRGAPQIWSETHEPIFSDRKSAQAHRPGDHDRGPRGNPLIPRGSGAAGHRAACLSHIRLPHRRGLPPHPEHGQVFRHYGRLCGGMPALLSVLQRLSAPKCSGDLCPVHWAGLAAAGGTAAVRGPQPSGGPGLFGGSVPL